MILRRLGEGIRKQDWFTVVVEIFIVVIGIYIGLQVDDWQKDRTERVREQFVLAQLHQDMIENKEIVIYLIEAKLKLVDGLYVLYQAAKEGKFEEKNRETINWAYDNQFQFRGLQLVMGTYSSLVAAGEFNILRDNKLRKQLLSLDSYLEFEKSQLNYFRNYEISTLNQYYENLTIRPNEDKSGTISEINIKAVSADPIKVTLLAERWGSHKSFNVYRVETLEQIENILTRLEELGVSNDPS